MYVCACNERRGWAWQDVWVVVSTEIYIVETETDAFPHTLTLRVYALHWTGLSKSARQNYGLSDSTHFASQPLISTYSDMSQEQWRLIMIRHNTHQRCIYSFIYLFIYSLIVHLIVKTEPQNVYIVKSLDECVKGTANDIKENGRGLL
jgi:hypothetical protein